MFFFGKFCVCISVAREKSHEANILRYEINGEGGIFWPYYVSVNCSLQGGSKNREDVVIHLLSLHCIKN